MVDEFNSWFLAVGDDVEIADLVMESSDGAPSIACRACGRESFVAPSTAQTALLCACGAVILEIVAHL